MRRKIYQEIASRLQAITNCRENGNVEWQHKHRDAVDSMVRDHLPSGSGFDNGTKLDDRSTPERLVFNTAFHHMNENGFYDGWTEHTVTVKPSLALGYQLKISGRDRNEIKEYIAETFGHALDSEIEE